LSFTDVAREDQAGAPAERSQNAFKFDKDGSTRGYYEITIFSLRVCWKAFPRNRKLRK